MENMSSLKATIEFWTIVCASFLHNSFLLWLIVNCRLRTIFWPYWILVDLLHKSKIAKMSSFAAPPYPQIISLLKIYSSTPPKNCWMVFKPLITKSLILDKAMWSSLYLGCINFCCMMDQAWGEERFWEKEGEVRWHRAGEHSRVLEGGRPTVGAAVGGGELAELKENRNDLKCFQLICLQFSSAIPVRLVHSKSSVSNYHFRFITLKFIREGFKKKRPFL